MVSAVLHHAGSIFHLVCLDSENQHCFASGLKGTQALSTSSSALNELQLNLRLLFQSTFPSLLYWQIAAVLGVGLKFGGSAGHRQHVAHNMTVNVSRST